MATYTYRGNLYQPSYPMLATDQGRTVIVSNLDQTYVVGLNAEGQFDKQKEIPAAYYMENVIPAVQGYKSIAYKQMIEGNIEMHQIIEITDPKSNFGYLGFGVDNHYYLANKGPNGTYVWIDFGSVDPDLIDAIDYLTPITTAVVNGKFYFYVPFINCYSFNPTLLTISQITLVGLDPTKVVGISSAFGYLIAYTQTAIAWSSLVNPQDFTPDLKTGAGGGDIEQARGNVTFIYPIYQGFIIYTSGNILVGTYSNNVRFPFAIRELVGSGGVSDRRLIAVSETGNSHYAYTTQGMQEISIRETSIPQAAITEFLSGGVIEDFSLDTGEFTRRTSNVPLDKKLSICGNRYLIISYGIRTGDIPNYDYAIVFDLSLKRYGKLKISHMDMFAYSYLNNARAELFDSSQLNIAFLKNDGSVTAVDCRDVATGKDGILILGKYQGVRNNLLQIVSVDIENASPSCQIYDLYSIDGKNTQKTELAYTQISHGGLLRKLGQVTGVNHTFVIKGDFNLNTFIFTYWIHGRR